MSPAPRPLPFLAAIAPGLLLAVAIAAVGTLIGQVVPLVGSAVPGIVLGTALGALIRPGARLRPGIGFASKRVLQFAVVLLGTQLSLAEAARVGLRTLPVLLGTLAICLVAAWLLSRALRVRGGVATLIGVGTGICGASAIAATAPVIGAAAAEVSYAVSTIFLFNVAAVILFPLVGHLLGMSQASFGLFAGTAVNDTSSVVAAAGTYGRTATDTAVVVKLVRTLAIIPITIVLAAWTRRREAVAVAGGTGAGAGAGPKAIGTPDAAAAPAAPSRPSPLARVGAALRLIPWFLIGFVVAAAVNSTGVIPAAAHPGLAAVSQFLIAVALSAIGLSTDLPAIRRAGWRPLALGGLLWLVVSLSSLGLQTLTGSL